MRFALTLVLPLALLGCRDNEPVDLDGDGFIADDCNDADALVYPGAVELCNGVDDDCNVLIDDEPDDAVTFYADRDGDGYGSASDTESACDLPNGFVVDSSDCDDASDEIHPGATEADCTDSTDYNCDGSVGYADADGDGWPACQDCDDALLGVSPDADETCDGIDNDCDGASDETGSIGESNWYPDSDGDGYGDPLQPMRACDQPTGYVSDNLDCNDSSADAHPGGVESCDNLDNDCDGEVDDNAPDASTWYGDGDSDGYGNPAVSVQACSAPAGFLADSSDCDDSDVGSNPDAVEVCDDIDNNCDSDIDEGFDKTWFADFDADGHGYVGWTVEDCVQPVGFASTSDDCDDDNSAAYPGATEVCDEADNNCDGTVDEGVSVTWYLDGDGDDHGRSTVTSDECVRPAGYVAASDDCDDTDSAAYPGNTEVCDKVDNNCDGSIDEGVTALWFLDGDGDGHGRTGVTSDECTMPAGFAAIDDDCDDLDGNVNPDEAQVCNGIDDDCSGLPSDEVDGDDDGFMVCENDCDDTDAAINTDATEIWYDNVDQDCDAGSDYDQDGDGDDIASSGGTDLNDLDPTCTTDCIDGSTQATAGLSCDSILTSHPSSADGPYWLDPDDDGDTSDAVETFCDMTRHGGGWTLVYKISDNSSMKSNGAVNVANLLTDDNSLATVGKLDDGHIRDLYTDQIRIDQYGANNNPFFCTIDNIAAYNDNTVNTKKCSTTYDSGAGYTAGSGGSYAYSFGSWYTTGSIIVQLNYNDSRLGSHTVYGGSSSDGGCTSSGGCHAQVWIR